MHMVSYEGVRDEPHGTLEHGRDHQSFAAFAGPTNLGEEASGWTAICQDSLQAEGLSRGQLRWTQS